MIAPKTLTISRGISTNKGAWHLGSFQVLRYIRQSDLECPVVYLYNQRQIRRTINMSTCRTCGDYYSKHSTTGQCGECLRTLNYPEFDEEDTLEVNGIINPNGKKPPVFYDD